LIVIDLMVVLVGMSWDIGFRIAGLFYD